jgi:hypothetical protein
MHQNEIKCTSRTNRFDLAPVPCLVFQLEPVNAFESIEAVLAATFQEEPFETYFVELPDFPSLWHTYWTDAAIQRVGLDINHPVFGKHCTMYY